MWNQSASTFWSHTHLLLIDYLSTFFAIRSKSRPCDPYNRLILGHIDVHVRWQCDQPIKSTLQKNAHATENWCIISVAFWICTLIFSHNNGQSSWTLARPIIRYSLMHNLAWHIENGTEKQSKSIVNRQANTSRQMENDWNDGGVWASALPSSSLSIH